MLDYLGSTMPGAVPSGPSPNSIQGPAPVAPDLSSAIVPSLPPPGLAPNPDDPSNTEYAAVTQADGSVLLHLKNADGSLGPAVKIVYPKLPSVK
jgi:hypothetical protein